MKIRMNSSPSIPNVFARFTFQIGDPLVLGAFILPAV
jgi:hypothetical protein